MNIKQFLRVSLLLGICLASLKTAWGQADPVIVKAYESEIESESEFKTLTDFIRASGEDDKWREVNWIPSLWEGIQASSRQHKPMFIWAMNGNPLGCV